MNPPRSARKTVVMIEISVQLPPPPNFLRTSVDGAMVDVGHLSEEQLRAIGAQWTNELVAHAAARRHAARMP